MQRWATVRLNRPVLNERKIAAKKFQKNKYVFFVFSRPVFEGKNDNNKKKVKVILKTMRTDCG